MVQKRKNDSGTSTARERKKQKMTVARTIDIQTASGEGSSAGGPSNVAATAATTNSLKGLPNVIDVEKFAETRAFEIDAMQRAIKNASSSSTHRAWQELPRRLRRRAASHNVRRVPLRLREKARQEMDPVKKKLLGRSISKLGKGKRISRRESLLRRQRDKTWLETHIWHAKRMKMENMWGYRLGVHTTDKSFRPSHRASVHGCILHDASYHSLIELKGRDNILQTVLETCCDPQASPGAKRYTPGARIMETHIYKPGTYPFGLISPITIMWQPICPKLPSEAVVAQGVAESSDKTSDSSAGKKKQKQNKGKQSKRERKRPEPSPDSESSRTVWIRSHPAVFEDVFGALQTAASLALDALRNTASNEANEGQEVEIELADLRGHVNVFELMGPKASQIIKGALTPVSEEKREEFSKFWRQLGDVQTTGSLPRGMIIGFKVHDPRLQFPPKNAKPTLSQPSTAKVIPTPNLAQSEIWDEKIRNQLKTPRYRKHDLDSRRAKNLVPGTGLHPSQKDNRVPVLLVQRSVGSPSTVSGDHTLHGWTLVIPAGWSMAFFSSLIYTGTLVGGQRERQTQAFESGSAYFPRDYPATVAYNTFADGRETQEKAQWERKPPAKRPNFEKLSTRSPWKPDWKVVLGLEEPGDDVEEDLVPTDRTIVPAVPDKAKIQPWLLRGPDLLSVLARLSSMLSPGLGLWDEVNKLRMKRGRDPLNGSIKADDLMKSALVTVKLVMRGRGAPDDLAIIYRVDDGEAKKWNKVWELKRTSSWNASDEETPDETQLSEVRPLEDSIIGYVTTGNFSLSRGEGFAIGAIPVARLFELKEQSERIHPTPRIHRPGAKPPRLLVKLRSRDGDRCRAAHLEVLEGQ